MRGDQGRVGVLGALPWGWGPWWGLSWVLRSAPPPSHTAGPGANRCEGASPFDPPIFALGGSFL